MKRCSIRAAAVAYIAALVLASTGCATIEKENAMSTERMLAASGFQMKLADTPQKLAHLKTLTQRTLVRHDKDGQPFYVYADASGCQCLYLGDQKAYGEYQKLDISQNIAEMNQDASMNTAMDWDMWGPMGGGFGW